MKTLLSSTIFFFLFIPTASALEVFEFTYTGNSSNDRDIAHGLSGAPDYCVVKSDAGDDPVFKTSDSNFTTDTTLPWRQNSSSGTEGIESLGATNVRIDSNSHTNQSGLDYYMMCVKCAGDGDCEVGTYEGTGSPGRTVTFSSVTAVQWVGIKNFDNTDTGVHSFKSDTISSVGCAFHEFNGCVVASQITSLGTDGMTLAAGGETNTGGETYMYVAFGTDSDEICQNTFDQTGADDYNVTGCGFDPEFVFMQTERDNGDSWSVMSGDNLGDAADDTYNYSFGAHQTNEIQDTVNVGSTPGDGFQIGTAAAANLCTGPCDSGIDVAHYIGLKSRAASAETYDFYIDNEATLKIDNGTLKIDGGGG